jgi:beta-glucosidase
MKTKDVSRLAGPRLGTSLLFTELFIGFVFAIRALAAPDPEMDRFVSDLLAKMTLEERIGQLNLLSVGFDVTGPIVNRDVEDKIRRGLVGGVFNTYTPAAVKKLQERAVNESRLHIPLLFGYDVIHGHKTIFPIPLGLACTWDLELIEQSARIAAAEASADGLHWTFSPMVDIARDPRWGRIAEGAGEDPYLGSQIARSMVRGYQGHDLRRSNNLMACVKHFALYGAAEGGRDYNTVDMSRIRMYEYYLPPYRAAVDAGVGSVMSSFNEVDAVPATGNRWLLTELLRQQWGFQGFIVTDYTAINEMVQHGTGDLKRNAALALNAGIDMDMVGETFIKNLQALVAEGAVSEAQISQACKRILEAKYKLGLFSDPYRACSEQRAQTEILTPAHREAARQAAAHSFVLLKNNAQILPLKKSGTIALIGPLADRQRDVIGSWSAAGDPKQAVSVFEGIKRNTGPELKILQAKGANLVDDPGTLKVLNNNGAEIAPDKRSAQELIDEAVGVARQVEVIVAVLGESFGMSGEAASRSDISLPEGQQELLKALAKTGKPIVLVLMNGRPLCLTWEDSHCQAILETWFGGTEAGNAVAKTKGAPSGDVAPSDSLYTSGRRTLVLFQIKSSSYGVKPSVTYRRHRRQHPARRAATARPPQFSRRLRPYNVKHEPRQELARLVRQHEV